MEPEEAIAILEKAVSRLNKEVKELTSIVERFDKEVNRQHRLISQIRDYCYLSSMTVAEYQNLVKLIEKGEIE